MADSLSKKAIEQRRDAAVRRALATPPKPLKDVPKQRPKKQQDEHPTASSSKRD